MLGHGNPKNSQFSFQFRAQRVSGFIKGKGVENSLSLKGNFCGILKLLASLLYSCHVSSCDLSYGHIRHVRRIQEHTKRTILNMIIP